MYLIVLLRNIGFGYLIKDASYNIFIWGIVNLISDWETVYVITWKECGKFEANEIKSWQSKNPILTEARTCARVEAYVKLAEKLADRTLE